MGKKRALSYREEAETRRLHEQYQAKLSFMPLGAFVPLCRKLF